MSVAGSAMQFSIHFLNRTRMTALQTDLVYVEQITRMDLFYSTVCFSFAISTIQNYLPFLWYHNRWHFLIYCSSFFPFHSFIFFLFCDSLLRQDHSVRILAAIDKNLLWWIELRWKMFNVVHNSVVVQCDRLFFMSFFIPPNSFLLIFFHTKLSTHVITFPPHTSSYTESRDRETVLAVAPSLFFVMWPAGHFCSM